MNEEDKKPYVKDLSQELLKALYDFGYGRTEYPICVENIAGIGLFCFHLLCNSQVPYDASIEFVDCLSSSIKEVLAFRHGVSTPSHDKEQSDMVETAEEE